MSFFVRSHVALVETRESGWSGTVPLLDMEQLGDRAMKGSNYSYCGSRKAEAMWKECSFHGWP